MTYEQLFKHVEYGPTVAFGEFDTQTLRLLNEWRKRRWDAMIEGIHYWGLPVHPRYWGNPERFH